MEVFKRFWGIVSVEVTVLLLVAGPVLVGVDWLIPATRLGRLGLTAFCGGIGLLILRRIDAVVGRTWAAGERAGDRRRALEAETPVESAAGEKRKDRPRLGVIKGGLVGAGIWSGVEWLRSGRRIAAALVATGITVSGATIAEHPGSPGADPPTQVITRPPKAEPTKRPTVRPSTALIPRGTSPPRTRVPMRVSPPAEPVTTKPVVRPTVKPNVVKPTVKPSVVKPSVVEPPSTAITPPSTPVVSLPVAPTITVPVTVSPSASCTIDLLGVKVCLPLG